MRHVSLLTRFYVWSLAVLWLATVGTPLLHSTVRFKLDDGNLPDGKVQFEPGPCDPQTGAFATTQLQTQAETEKYMVFTDITNIKHGNGDFVYEFFVKSKTPGSALVCRFRVPAVPTGSFADAMGTVKFHVGDGLNLEEGTIKIPLYSIRNPKILDGRLSKPSVDAQNPLVSVNLTGETPIEITVSSKLEDLQLGLYKDIKPRLERPQNWQSSTATLDGSNVLEPGHDAVISLKLVPNAWHALGTSIFPIEQKKPHEVITVRVNYDTPGGIPDSIDVEVPVRFRPSIWSLLLAVMLGAGLGTLLARLLPSKSDGEPVEWYKAYLVSLVAAGLAEIVGIILVSGGSEFRFFQFELDPYQILPAVLVGALVGLAGIRKASDFFGWFKKKP
jgi:hypothetical protein